MSTTLRLADAAASEGGASGPLAALARAVARLRPRAAPAPVIEFLCEAGDRGVVAEPVPARSALPDWFRRIPGVDRAELTPTNNGLTVKRCMPVLDALGTGWIIPLAATVRLKVSEGGRRVDAGWDFDREMISYHPGFQVAGHPRADRPACKFMNPWAIRTAPGWSTLFVPPLNRPNDLFECLAGVVDTDTYPALIHFPFFATAEDGLHVIEKGTPLVQAIPFRRDEAAIAGRVRAETEAEAAERERALRATRAGDGWYRNAARAAR
jgi:hypothetical protein